MVSQIPDGISIELASLRPASPMLSQVMTNPFDEFQAELSGVREDWFP
ncbi:MAG: hypothetical protein NT172_12140 [Planctomycetota bacterium]|nr:hypothetical protein [Planctomycetota bacterium]